MAASTPDETSGAIAAGERRLSKSLYGFASAITEPRRAGVANEHLGQTLPAVMLIKGGGRARIAAQVLNCLEGNILLRLHDRAARIESRRIYDVIDRGRKGGIVTAFVMTNTMERGKVLMYRGRVHEIFLIQDGKISYVILKNCAKFFMAFADDAPVTGKQLELFRGASRPRI